MHGFSDGGRGQWLNGVGQLSCMPSPKSLFDGESRESMVINRGLSSGSVAGTLGGQQPGPPGELMVSEAVWKGVS